MQCQEHGKLYKGLLPAVCKVESGKFKNIAERRNVFRSPIMTLVSAVELLISLAKAWLSQLRLQAMRKAAFEPPDLFTLTRLLPALRHVLSLHTFQRSVFEQ